MQKSQEIAKRHAIQNKEINKRNCDKKLNNVEFNSDLVYLINEKSKLGKSKKLTPHYEGPYEVLEINSPANCTIRIKNKKTKVHTNKLKQAFVSDT